MPDVFISYNREDRETARHVASALEAEGFSVWWDAALRAGETYDEVTEQNLRQAGAVVVLWSKRSANSKWVRAEATVGERSSTLVPVLIEDCERPIRFELVQTADLRHWRGDRNDAHWRAFIGDVKTAISRRGAKAAAPGVAAAAAPAHDVSIETTFWNSIKDGTDGSDFEAYLKRYPHGHFAALAQNRIAALGRRAAPAAPARPASPPQPPRAAAAPRPQPAPARAAPPPKKSASGLIFAGLAAAVAAVGAGAFVFMSQDREPAAEERPAAVAAEAPQVPQIAAAIPEAPPPDQLPADAVAGGETAPEAPLTDVYAEGATDAASDAEGALAQADATAPGESPAAAVDAPAVAPGPVAAAADAKPVKVRSAKTFRDCDGCPLMAKLPKGSFVMGSPGDEPGRNAYEGPQREVSIRPFAIGVYEVSVAEWNACAADGACPRKAGEEKFPALGVSFQEASAYADWLTKRTKRKYRVPTEAEWEYAARAGTVTAYWWGDHFERSRLATGSAQAVGSAEANAFGLHDILGNAREWVADCYVNNYAKAPADGSAVADGDCSKRVIRGGAWSSSPTDMRVANRSRVDVGVHAGYMGVRLAADDK